MLLGGWVTAGAGVSETGRRVQREIAEYEQATVAVQAILRMA
jgi:hypothetical protein